LIFFFFGIVRLLIFNDVGDRIRVFVGGELLSFKNLNSTHFGSLIFIFFFGDAFDRCRWLVDVFGCLVFDLNLFIAVCSNEKG
jgi:hypothetical protein